MSAIIKKPYHCCCVPKCSSTSVTFPDKLFFSTPKDLNRKKLWLKMCRRDIKTSSPKSVFFLCEDHFNLQEDAANFMQYHLCGVKPVLKKDCVPSRFDCQGKASKSGRDSSVMREKRRTVANLLSHSKEEQAGTHHENVPLVVTTSRSPFKVTTDPCSDECERLQQSTSDLGKAPSVVTACTSPFKVTTDPCSDDESERVAQSSRQVQNAPIVVTTSTSPFKVTTEPSTHQSETVHSSNTPQSTSQRLTTDASKAVTVSRVLFHDHDYVTIGGEMALSASIQQEIPEKAITQPSRRGPKCKSKHFRSVQTQCRFSPYKNDSTSEKRDDNTNKVNPPSIQYQSSTESDSDTTNESDCSLWSPGSDVTNDDETELHNVKWQALNVTRYYMIVASMLYLGVPENYTFIFKLLDPFIAYAGKIFTKIDIVSIVFRKIRLNECFTILGHCYGVSEDYVSKIFSNYIVIIGQQMLSLVKWLPSDTILTNLPLAFWARYRNVVIIIDAFEVQIETPMVAMDQSETWSDYKKCNTFKFVIGISPDGTIMFISKGYLGRFTDMDIIKDSKFVDLVPEGKDVMADRGFKGLDALLAKKKSKLVRPPSVISNEAHDKSLVKVSKQVSSLRIHVERSIRRIREFAMLEPHATLNHQFYDNVDYIVGIACGLVNIQNQLIKI